MKKILLTLLATLFFTCQTGFALDLQGAKAQGLIGETLSGYLAPVKSTPEVQKIVQDINRKRKAKYKEIAKSTGTNLQTVEHLAGKTAIDKTPAGQYIKAGGGWKKK